MQHIVNIAFDFDDEKASKAAEKAVENEIDNIIKEIVMNHIAPLKTTFYGKKERDWESFNDLIGEAIKTLLEDKKEEIIELAADKLTESYKRTKAWKEKTNDVRS